MPTSSRADVGSEATRAAMNDSPADCQNREWTKPQRDSAPTDPIYATIETAKFFIAKWGKSLYNRYVCAYTIG